MLADPAKRMPEDNRKRMADFATVVRAASREAFDKRFFGDFLAWEEEYKRLDW